MYFLLLLITLLPNYVISSEILSCGGFIKSDFNIKFSRVELKLYSKQGSLKYQTDCAPNNGYYFIPLYDKGEYVLKVEPPNGWTFDPKSISLHVDGVNDACSQSQDINFAFTGFTLTGQVVSKGSNSGPANLKISLRNGKKELIKETTTSADGSYSFNEVLPGEYIVSVSHPQWKFEKGEVGVVVTQDNEKIQSHLVVAGYDVRGQVSSDGEPIRGVHFLLFSKDGAAGKDKGSFEGCDRSKVKGFNHGGAMTTQYVCHVTSNEDGHFVFPSVVPGSYEVLPFYSGEHIEFDVEPGKVDVKVGHGSVEISKQFLVQGFSVSGRVLKSPNDNVGIKGAKIFLDGMEQAITQEGGVYHLENMKTGTYKLEVFTPNYYFESTTVKITPNTPHLVEKIASKYDVCGRFRLSLSEVDFSLAGRHVTVVEKGGVANGHVTTLTTNPDGSFCVPLAKGTFTFKAIVANEEAESGLQFVPDEKSVNVIDRPIVDLLFSQFSATVTGQVKCIEKCDEVQLSLTPARGNGDGFEIVPIENGKFSIANLLPGEYQLNVLKPEWCWSKNQLDFTVVNRDISGLSFSHTGYQVSIVSSHSTDIEIKHPGGATRVIKLDQNAATECLSQPGEYILKPTGCHIFQEDAFKFNTKSPQVLSLTATKHLVSGKVVTSENVTDIRLFVSKEWNGIVETENMTLRESHVTPKTFPFSFWAHPQSTLRAKPSSDILLFQPQFVDLNVADDCILNAVSFKGKTGLFIRGSITPTISTVTIRVLLDEDNGSFSVIKDTQSDQQGKFVVGPLIEDKNYRVEAEREGYTFKALGKELGQFQAFKLAEIFVTIVDESNGQGLTGVLVSLSGGNDYRKNSVTQIPATALQFLGLGPGEYFLRPVMKEYQFEPASQMISIGEGATVNVTIKGKRVAFSCFGLVNSLTGEPEPGLVIEATGQGSESCGLYQEEANSEADGTFRIRGLQPNCNYNIRMKSGMEENAHVERVSPKEKLVQVGQQDIHNVRLIVLRHFNQMDVSGYVQTKQEFLSTLKVRLFREDSPDQASQTLTLGQSSFFHLPLLALDNKGYLLRLDSSLPSNQYHLDLPSVSFRANETYRHFNLAFKPRSRNSDQEMAQGSLLVLPLVLVVSILCFNYNKVLPVFAQIAQLAQNFVLNASAVGNTRGGSPGGPSTSNNPDMASNPDSIGSKKRTKLRRT